LAVEWQMQLINFPIWNLGIRELSECEKDRLVSGQTKPDSNITNPDSRCPSF